MDVPLTRMARTEMADRVKMFELFTELQQILVQYGDQHHAKVLESIIALCKKMEENNAHRDTTIVHNVLDMQQTCMTALQNLNDKLKSLHSSVESHVDGYRDQIMELQVIVISIVAYFAGMLDSMCWDICHRPERPCPVWML